MIVVIGGKSIKGNIVVTVNNEEAEPPIPCLSDSVDGSS